MNWNPIKHLNQPKELAACKLEYIEGDANKFRLSINAGKNKSIHIFNDFEIWQKRKLIQLTQVHGNGDVKKYVIRSAAAMELLRGIFE